MADIEITPININGVKLPFNLLDNLLGQQIDYTNLTYPMDLATNPQYCHAIQFSIHDYKYPVVDGYYQQASAALSNAGVAGAAAAGSVSNINPNVSDMSAKSLGTDLSNKVIQATKGASIEGAKAFGSQFLGQVSGAVNYNFGAALSGAGQGIKDFMGKAPGDIGEFLTKYAPLATPGNYKRTVEENRLASISLYMPDTLVTNFSSNYDPVSLTKAFGIVGYAANAYADYMKNKDAMDNNPSNIISDDYRRGLAGAATEAIAGEGLGAAVQNALKRVPNPQVQLLYRGINLREFNFEFTFTPSSSKEAEEIDEIIKTFTYYSLPDITSGHGGQFFIPPQVFRIKFAFLGSDGVAGQIFDVFKTNMTNILGNQFTKIITGSNPTDDITKAKTAKIFQIGDCVLKDIQVNYAPNGWASYQDGYPIQTTLSLTFGEIELVNKQTPGVKPKDTSNYVNRDNQDYVNSIGGISYVKNNLPPV